MRVWSTGCAVYGGEEAAVHVQMDDWAKGQLSVRSAELLRRLDVIECLAELNSTK